MNSRREGKGSRETFKQEALSSWSAYQETGRHLAGPEVRTSLNTWGTEDEKVVPEHRIIVRRWP